MILTRIAVFTASLLWSVEQVPVYLEIPYGPAKRLTSPDGSYALYGDSRLPQVWLVDERSHKRRLAHTSPLTLNTVTLSCAPDSESFVVNDRESSNFEASYLYRARDLARIELRQRILSSDHSAQALEQSASHTYVEAIRWLDSSKVEARLSGHSDGRRKQPGLCFDLRYQVGRDGMVEKLSQQTFPLGSLACGGVA